MRLSMATRMTAVARLCVACGLVLASSTSVLGQGLEVGARGGVNLATISFSGDGDGPSRQLRVGGVVGGFVVFPLTSSLAAQVEGLYAMKGVRITDRGVESSLGIDYLEVPLLARFTWRGASRNYYAAAGPALALRLRARTRVDFGTAIEEIDVSDDVERFDVGIAMGGGVELGRLVIDGRYTLGMRDIDVDKTDSVAMKHRVISITVGLRF